METGVSIKPKKKKQYLGFHTNLDEFAVSKSLGICSLKCNKNVETVICYSLGFSWKFTSDIRCLFLIAD